VGLLPLPPSIAKTTISVAPVPFILNSAYHDPTFTGTTSAWALWVQSSSNIMVFGMLAYFIRRLAHRSLDGRCWVLQLLHGKIQLHDFVSNLLMPLA
jgi:hypothetical protein